MARTLDRLARAVASPRYRRKWRRYRRETRRPLQCLVFLAPLVLVYETWALWADHGGPAARELLAHSAIAGLLVWFGLAGIWVPPAVFVAALLVWHRLRRDSWRISVGVLPWMVGESILAAIPLLVISAMFSTPPASRAGGWSTRLMVAVGAGVYEELVFRLLLIGGLVWLLSELIHVSRVVAPWVAVGLAAILFSLCHFDPIGSDAFSWGSFWFRVVAGLYLSAVFINRGLGLASGCHVAYNLLLACVRGGS